MLGTSDGRIQPRRSHRHLMVCYHLFTRGFYDIYIYGKLFFVARLLFTSTKSYEVLIAISILHLTYIYGEIFFLSCKIRYYRFLRSVKRNLRGILLCIIKKLKCAQNLDFIEGTLRNLQNLFSIL